MSITTFISLAPNKILFYKIDEKKFVVLKNEKKIACQFPELNYTTHKTKCESYTKNTQCLGISNVMATSDSHFEVWGNQIFALTLEDSTKAVFYWPNDDENIVWLKDHTTNDIINDSLLVYTDDNGKKGIKHPKGKIIVPAIYDELVSFNKPFSYKIKLPFYKSMITHPSVYTYSQKNIIKAIKGDSLTLIDIYGKTYFPFQKYKDLQPIYEFYRPNEFPEFYWKVYDENNRCGIINKKGEVIINPKYEDVIVLGRRYFKGILISNEVIINSDNKTLPFPKDASFFMTPTDKRVQYKYWTFYKHKEKLGVIDTLGNIVLEPKYNEISYLGNDYFKVEQFFKREIIHVKGEIIPCPKNYDIFPLID